MSIPKFLASRGNSVLVVFVVYAVNFVASVLLIWSMDRHVNILGHSDLGELIRTGAVHPFSLAFVVLFSLLLLVAATLLFFFKPLAFPLLAMGLALYVSLLAFEVFRHSVRLYFTSAYPYVYGMMREAPIGIIRAMMLGIIPGFMAWGLIVAWRMRRNRILR